MVPLQQQWVAALLSGKYKQGFKALYYNGYCCLGAADKELHLKEGNDLYLADTYPELGLRSTDGTFELPISVYGKEYFSLASMNDARLSFQDIALIIQNNWHLIFTEQV